MFLSIIKTCFTLVVFLWLFLLHFKAHPSFKPLQFKKSMWLYEIMWFKILTTARSLKYKPPQQKMPVNSLHDFLWHGCFLSGISYWERKMQPVNTVMTDVLGWLMYCLVGISSLKVKIGCLFIQEYAFWNHFNIKIIIKRLKS